MITKYASWTKRVKVPNAKKQNSIENYKDGLKLFGYFMDDKKKSHHEDCDTTYY